MRTKLLALTLLAACGDPAAGTDTEDGSSGDASSTGAPTTGPGETEDTPGDPSILVGSFQIQLVAPTGSSAGKTAILGKVYDGPTPAPIVWEDSTAAADCLIKTPRVPFCSVSCGGSAVCVEDETCQDYPTAHSAGTVTVTGLALTSGDPAFEMEPIADNYQPGAGVTFPYPPFAEGDAITVSAAGDWFHAFEIAATGVAPLDLTADSLELSADTPLDLTWTPGGNADARIKIKLDISHHGGTRGMIACDTADTGALTIDGALVTELLALGVSGFPTIIVTREVVGATTISAGRVELVVSSSIESAVTIPGLESCTSDAECPDGQTCQPDLSCQ